MAKFNDNCKNQFEKHYFDIDLILIFDIDIDIDIDIAFFVFEKLFFPNDETIIFISNSSKFRKFNRSRK